MLDIFSHLIPITVLFCFVLGAPLEPLEIADTTSLSSTRPIRHRATHGPHTATQSTTTDPATTATSTQNLPTSTTGTTTTGIQTTTGSTGTGNCPTTSSTPKCYRYHSDFPPSSQWMSLACIISHARPDMVTFSNDGPDEADNVISAVQSVSQQAGIDPYVSAEL